MEDFQKTIDGEKFGVLEFSYNNNESFQNLLNKKGSYSINLGDYIQSHAVKNALIDIGVEEKNIYFIDRDNISSSGINNINVVMNGVFYPCCFPLPPNINPIYFGFSYHYDNIFPWDNKSIFYKTLLSERTFKYQTIGCRDHETALLFNKNGFKAYVSGCLSQSLKQNKLDYNDSFTKIPLFCGIENSKLSEKLKIENDAYIYLKNQRKDFNVFPLKIEQMQNCRLEAKNLLTLYSNHCSICITSLLHCAGPCAAIGIPAIIVREDPNNLRFSSIRNYLEIYRASSDYSFEFFATRAKTMNIRNNMLSNLINAICESINKQKNVNK